MFGTCYRESKQSVDASFPPHLTSASALPEKMRHSVESDKMVIKKNEEE